MGEIGFWVMYLYFWNRLPKNKKAKKPYKKKKKR